MTEELKGNSEKAHVMLLFHLISSGVKFGTFPLFLQSLNSVRGQ